MECWRGGGPGQWKWGRGDNLGFQKQKKKKTSNISKCKIPKFLSSHQQIPGRLPPLTPRPPSLTHPALTANFLFFSVSFFFIFFMWVCFSGAGRERKKCARDREFRKVCSLPSPLLPVEWFIPLLDPSSHSKTFFFVQERRERGRAKDRGERSKDWRFSVEANSPPVAPLTDQPFVLGYVFLRTRRSERLG